MAGKAAEIDRARGPPRWRQAPADAQRRGEQRQSAAAPPRRPRSGPISGRSRTPRSSDFKHASFSSIDHQYRELCNTEYMISARRLDWRCERQKSLPCAHSPKARIDCPDARSRTPAQRARIHGVRTVLRAEADGGGRLWPCPGPRRNLRVPRAALLRPLLFRAEGRERQDRGGDLEGRACAGCGSSRRKGSRSSPPASSPPIPARRNTRS